MRKREQSCWCHAGYRDLPTDVNFAWSQDSYSKTQRTIGIWSALATLRTRAWLNEAKWTYPGGFTDAKQSARLCKFVLITISKKRYGCTPG